MSAMFYSEAYYSGFKIMTNIQRDYRSELRQCTVLNKRVKRLQSFQFQAEKAFSPY